MEDINLQKTYILNPKYSIYPDNNRILLTNIDEEPMSAFFIFIHPVHALILSEFDGTKTLNEITKELAAQSSVSQDEILKIVKPLIGNEKEVNLKYDSTVFSFPENMIIEKKDDTPNRSFNKNELMLPRPYDFITTRLNSPKRLLLVMNTNCVTDCLYCYADRKTKYQPMPFEKLLDIIDEASALGIRAFDLSGGEIFNHKNWDIFLSKLIKNGYEPYVSTKMTITREMIDRAYEIGLRTIQVSLDTLDPSLVKKNLNINPDYAEKIKNTILELDRKGFTITLKSTVTKYTCTTDNINAILDFAQGLKNIKQYTFTPTGYTHYKTVEHFNRIKPSTEQTQKISSLFKAREKEFSFPIYDDNNTVTDGSECCNTDSFNGRSLCTGNQDGFVILPDGNVTICEELYWDKNFIIGNVMESSISEIWASEKAVSLFKVRQENFPEDSSCKSCDVFEKCRYGLGVCWKNLIASYGRSNWLYPDIRCPRAPKPIYPVFYNNSFLEL